MADFGSLFDNLKSEADQRRAEEQATRDEIQTVKKARFDESMKAITAIVDPAFALAMRQLQSRGIVLSNNVSDKLLFENNERKPAKNYQLRLGHNTPGSTFHFAVSGTSHITCTLYPYDHRQDTRGRQILRCPLSDFNSDKVNEVIGMAVAEIAQSR